MQSITIRLETVTPLFLGGAESRGEPELRPPAFRGAMRYWMRALLGGKLGDTQEALGEIKNIEGSVFGIAGDENNNSASSIVIRIVNPNLKKSVSFKKEGSRSKPTGADYLYWSMDATNEDDNPVPARQYIPSGSSFDLVLNTRPGVVNPETTLKYARASLWLLTHLGGIGARSRHLAGNLTAKSSNIDNLDFNVTGKTETEVAGRLANAITNIIKGIEPGNTAVSDHQAEFDILNRSHCTIWVLEVFETSAEAIDSVGRRYHEFRSNKGDNDAPRWLLKRSIFGLPIAGIDGVERRSSPLWLSLIPITEGYAVVGTLFKSRFLKDKQKLDIKTRSGDTLKGQSPPADYSLISEWIEEKFKAEKVNYD